MPTINFPSGPSLNDSYNLGTRTWKWNGEAWALQPLTGGFTGSAGASGYTGSAGAGGSSGAIGYTGSTGVVLPLTIDTTNDRVGIGTTSPATSLHIAAQIPKIRIEDTDLSGMAFDIRGAGPAVHFDLDPGSSQALADYMWDIGGSTKMKLRGTGRLGIGTTTPSQALDVVGSIEVSDGIYIGGTAAANKLEATAAARAAAKVAAEDALLNRTPTSHPVSQPLPNTVEENSVFKYGDPVSVSDEAALEEAKRMRAMLLMIVGGIALVLILVATLG